jgi:hypothetical protein
MPTRPFPNSKGRLTVLLDGVDPNGPEFRAGLFRIGTLLRNRAVAHLTRQSAVDEGTLRASISFKIEASNDISRVIVGAFGIKYARMVEHGGAFTDQMRKAMFASFRDRGKPRRPGKGIISGGWYQARPFIGPAVKESQAEIIGILKDMVGRKGKILG